MRYRKKPIEVQAFRFTDSSDRTAPQWFNHAVDEEKAWIDRCLVDGHARIYGCSIRTPTGQVHAKLGDYIIREPDGTMYPCKPDVFTKTYEKAG